MSDVEVETNAARGWARLQLVVPCGEGWLAAWPVLPVRTPAVCSSPSGTLPLLLFCRVPQRPRDAQCSDQCQDGCWNKMSKQNSYHSDRLTPLTLHSASMSLLQLARLQTDERNSALSSFCSALLHLSKAYMKLGCTDWSHRCLVRIGSHSLRARQNSALAWKKEADAFFWSASTPRQLGASAHVLDRVYTGSGNLCQ